MGRRRKPADEVIAAAAAQYPTLFGTNAHALMKCQAHALLCNGSGYEWVPSRKGSYLADVCTLHEKRPRGRPRKDVVRRRWEDSVSEAQTIRAENDQCPQLTPGFSAEWCAAWDTPANVAADWRAVVEHTLGYFIRASNWHFGKYDGTLYAHSPTIHQDCLKELRRLEDKLRQTFPDWVRTKDLHEEWAEAAGRREARKKG